MLGTPHYASPEQLKGEPIDRRTDIYSTGVMAYEMLSGRRPFEPDNDSISSVILKVIQETPAPMDTDMSRLLPGDREHRVARDGEDACRAFPVRGRDARGAAGISSNSRATHLARSNRTADRRSCSLPRPPVRIATLVDQAIVADHVVGRRRRRGRR